MKLWYRLCNVKEVAQFFSLSLKPNVLNVWLAKGERKRLKTGRIQLIIHSIRHGTNLTSIELDKFSIFQTCRLGKTTKILVAKWVQILKKASCIV